MNMKLHPKVRRGDIFYAELGERVGSEQDGTRPVFVIQNNTGNENSPTVVVAILTSKIKKMHLPTHVYLGAQFGLTEESIVMLEQIVTIDRKRLRGYVGTLDSATTKKVEAAMRISLGLTSQGGCGK